MSLSAKGIAFLCALAKAGVGKLAKRDIGKYLTSEAIRGAENWFAAYQKSPEQIVKQCVSEVREELPGYPVNWDAVESKVLELSTQDFSVETFCEYVGDSGSFADKLLDAAEYSNLDADSRLDAMVRYVLSKVLQELTENYTQDPGNHAAIAAGTHAGMTRIEEKVDQIYTQQERNDGEVRDEIRKLLDKIASRVGHSIPENAKPCVGDRTQEYRDRWDQNLFLNNFSTKFGDKQGTNIQQSQLYIPPEFTWQEDVTRYSNWEDLLPYPDEWPKGLLVLGLPGVGKSTWITWLLNKFTGFTPNVYRFQDFPSQAPWVKWSGENGNLFQDILSATGLSEAKFRESYLILDGFDEISVEGTHTEVLRNLYTQYGNLPSSARPKGLIVTCRVNYVKPEDMGGDLKWITLQPLSEGQMDTYCKNYAEAAMEKVSDEVRNALAANQKVYGIPLILYMVLALHIAVGAGDSEVEVYGKIFDPINGGIYHRCLENRPYGLSTAENNQDTWKKLHQLSRDMAIRMFWEDKEEISVALYQELARGNGLEAGEDQVDHFKLLRHSESGAGTVYFVHRTMYEYFVADALVGALLPDGKAAENLAKLLMAGHFERDRNNISNYLTVMLEECYGLCNGEVGTQKGTKIYTMWEKAILKRMEYGVLDHLDRSERTYAERQRQDDCCFHNLMEFLQQLREVCGYTGLIGECRQGMREILEAYLCIARVPIDISCCSLPGIDGRWLNLSHASVYATDLSSATLQGVDWKGVKLCNVKLENVDFRDAHLQGASLHGANLRYADLTRADLRYACLAEVDLRNADLRNADLRDADLRFAKLGYANLTGARMTGAYLQRCDLTEKLLDSLKTAIFDYLCVADYGRGTLHRYQRDKFIFTFKKKS